MKTITKQIRTAEKRKIYAERLAESEQSGPAERRSALLEAKQAGELITRLEEGLSQSDDWCERLGNVLEEMESTKFRDMCRDESAKRLTEAIMWLQREME
jgi:hypothetical protein